MSLAVVIPVVGLVLTVLGFFFGVGLGSGMAFLAGVLGG